MDAHNFQEFSKPAQNAMEPAGNVGLINDILIFPSGFIIIADHGPAREQSPASNDRFDSGHGGPSQEGQENFGQRCLDHCREIFA